jgi:ABC-type polysaccharide/polyol phosphate export permease
MIFSQSPLMWALLATAVVFAVAKRVGERQALTLAALTGIIVYFFASRICYT